MDKQNVTLSLPKALLKKVKALAAKREKSLSELMRESLEEKVREASGYNKARRRQLKHLGSGFDLGTDGEIGIEREKLHERR
jgi:metal-responsive CopG/Arc/MetJ family transcriptional regulator